MYHIINEAVARFYRKAFTDPAVRANAPKLVILIAPALLLLHRLGQVALGGPQVDAVSSLMNYTFTLIVCW